MYGQTSYVAFRTFVGIDPKVHAASQKHLGLGEVGLFDKAAKGLRQGGKVRRRGRKFKPAIARFGAVGADAEGDKLPGQGGRRGGLNGVAEAGGFGDHMVRRGHQHQRAGRTSLKRQSGCADGGGGVFGRWFDQDVGGDNFKRGQLLDHDEAEVGGSDNCRRGKTGAKQASRRGLIKALVTRQIDELLGVGLARQGPEPRAGAATEEDWMN